jgi:hypothetical protein
MEEMSMATFLMSKETNRRAKVTKDVGISGFVLPVPVRFVGCGAGDKVLYQH